MLCDSTETALQIDSQWSRRQIHQSVRAALSNLECALKNANFS